jgi:hypothetical protein
MTRKANWQISTLPAKQELTIVHRNESRIPSAILDSAASDGRFGA